MLYREIIAVCSQNHTKQHRSVDSVKQGGDTRYCSSATVIPTAHPFHQHPTSRLSGQLCTRDKDRARHLRRSGLAITAAQETRFINPCTWKAASNRRPLHAVRNCTTAIWILRQPFVPTMWSSIRHLYLPH